jgi:hypothetical protein
MDNSARILVDGKLFSSPADNPGDCTFVFQAGHSVWNGHIVCWGTAQWHLTIEINGVCAVTREFRGMTTAEFSCDSHSMVAVRLARVLCATPTPMPAQANNQHCSALRHKRPVLPERRTGIDYFAEGTGLQWRQCAASLSPMMRFLQKHKNRFVWDSSV